MAPGSKLGESDEPIGGLVKVRPDVKSGLSFLCNGSHRGHCGQSAQRFLDCAPFKLCRRNAWEKVIAGPVAARSTTDLSASRLRRIQRLARPPRRAALLRRLPLLLPAPPGLPAPQPRK